VKHVHHAAKAFDIGVYFEANGHGTVLFSDRARQLISSPPAKYAPPSAVRPIKSEAHGRVVRRSTSGVGDPASGAPASAVQALTQLGHLLRLINHTVGDAISDMLLVEAALILLNLSLPAWEAQYTDLPNRLAKVAVGTRPRMAVPLVLPDFGCCTMSSSAPREQVKDRSVFETTDAERKVVKPAGLQGRIDQIVARFDRGRSFVRYANRGKPMPRQQHPVPYFSLAGTPSLAGAGTGRLGRRTWCASTPRRPHAPTPMPWPWPWPSWCGTRPAASARGLEALALHGVHV